MSELVVITFDSEANAGETLKRIRGIEKSGQIDLQDTAVIAKDADGKVHVKNEWSSGTEVGAVVGGGLGLLTSFILPVVGTIAGAALGGWIGSMFSEGVDKKFVEDVSSQLEPGKSALFLIVRDWNPAAVSAALMGQHGKILQTTLSPELVEGMEQALRQSS
jgi:uncharacterized membrane protein